MPSTTVNSQAAAVNTILQTVMLCDAWVVASNAPMTDLSIATILHDILGDKVQICDGVNDEVQINAAIATLSGGGGVRLSVGTFNDRDAIVMVHALNLIGAGRMVTIIKQDDNADITTGLIYSDDNWNRGVISDLTLDGNKANNSTGCIGLYLRGNWYSTVTRVEVKECRKDGVLLTSCTEGSYLGECYFEFVQVHDCTGDGWHISSVMDSVWMDCYEFNSGEDGWHIIGNANTFFHCHGYNDAWAAFELTVNAKHSTLINCGADEPGLHGFKIACDESRFIGCGAGGCSQHGVNYDGFYIGGKYNQILGCHIIDDDGNMDVAIREIAGADYNVVQGNVISDYKTNAVVLVGEHSKTLCFGNQGYIAPGEIRTAYGSFTKTGSSLTTVTGTFTESPDTLKPGANTIHCTADGTANVVIPTGCVGVAESGADGAAVANSPKSCPAGTTLITVTAGGTNEFTVTVTHMAAAWHNPEAQDVLVRRVVADITTQGGTESSVMQVGVADDAYGTNIGSEFFTGIDNNAAVIRDAWLAGDTGAMTKWVVLQDSASGTDGWIDFKISTEVAEDLVGNYYVEYAGRA